MARQFIVNEKDIIKVSDEFKNKEEANSIFKITGSEIKHIQVLRHNVGDNILVNNHICEILEITKISITLKCIGVSDKIGEPTLDITAYIAFLKGDKMEFVIQKAVELGVKKIVPFFSKNVIVKLDEKASLKRREKFQKIVTEACKQCGRTDQAEVGDFIYFTEMLSKIVVHDINIFAYEKENSSIKEASRKIFDNNYKNISVIVGAEGGFDKEEANKLRQLENVSCISLGSRILRAETATLCLLSILLYESEL